MAQRGQMAFGLGLLVLAGCAGLTGRPEVRRAAPPEFAGKVYLFRGGAGGAFSTGMDYWGQQLSDIGVPNRVGSHLMWRSWARTIAKESETLGGPIVLVGHSYGADAALRIAGELDKANVPVALLVTVDPVAHLAVPKNVRRAVNLYKSHALWDKTPVWHGIALAGESHTTMVENVRLQDHQEFDLPGTHHSNIDDNLTVQQEAIKQILRTCKR